MDKTKSDDAYEILLAEDNAADILLLQEALEDIELNINLRVVHNGEEAVSYLQSLGSSEYAVRPDIILLDLNLPRQDGFSVLQAVKQDPELRQIPVIILSTSQAQEDINRCYHLQANCFVSKPANLDHFMKSIRDICEFWLRTVKLPQRKISI